MRFLLMLIMAVCFGALLLTGCNTTFEQRKEVYKSVWEKVAPIMMSAGKIAAEKAVDKYEADGSIDTDTADKIKDQIDAYKVPATEPEAYMHKDPGRNINIAEYNIQRLSERAFDRHESAVKNYRGISSLRTCTC